MRGRGFSLSQSSPALQEQPAAPKPSLLGIIWSPGEQFDRMRANPRFWGPFIIVTLLTIVGMGIMALGMSESLTEELLSAGFSEEQVGSIVVASQVTIVVTGVFTPILTILISSAIYLAITKLAHKDTRFKQLLSMTTYIYFIGGIGVLLNQLVSYVTGGEPAIQVTSLASLVETEGRAVFGLLSNIEVFTIWGTILTAFGLERVGRLSKGAAWIVAIVFFLIGVVLTMIGGSPTGAAGV